MSREEQLEAALRELRDHARGLCETVQDMRGVDFARHYNCVWAIEQSEEVLPSMGLCTTMLSTKELSDRGRKS